VVDTPVSNFSGAAITAFNGSMVTVQGNVPISLSNSASGGSASNLSSLTISGKITVENNSGSGLTVFGNSSLLVGIAARET